jgi:hypothetical protein
MGRRCFWAFRGLDMCRNQYLFLCPAKVLIHAAQTRLNWTRLPRPELLVEGQMRFAFSFIMDISRTGLLICIKCLGLLIRILTAHIIGDQ